MANGNGGNPDETPINQLTREQFFEKTLKALTILLNGYFQRQMSFVLIVPESDSESELDRVNFISNIKPENLAGALRQAAEIIEQQISGQPPQTL